MNKDIKRLIQIAKQLITAGVEVADRNGLPYCKNCSIDLVDTGNTIGLISERLNKSLKKNYGKRSKK